MTYHAQPSVGFGSLLLLLFIALRLCHVIAWSWLWVLSPAWGPVALFVAAGVVYVVTAALWWRVVHRAWVWCTQR